MPSQIRAAGPGPLAFAVVAAVAALGSSGCRGGTYQVMDAPTKATGQFSAVYVGPVVMDAWIGNLAPEQQPRFERALSTLPERFDAAAKSLLAERFQLVGEPGEGTLVVQCELVEYNPGSRAARYFAGGFGAGHGKVGVKCTLVDGADSTPIGIATAIGTTRGGWFGGSIESAYGRSGYGLGKFIYDYY